MNKGNMTQKGRCTSCGQCCSDVLHLSKEEVNTIKQYMKDNEIDATQSLSKLFSNAIDLSCPFRDNKKKICKIYEVRPLICKMFLCHNPELTRKEERELVNGTRSLISMRNTFYNDDTNIVMMRESISLERDTV